VAVAVTARYMQPDQRAAVNVVGLIVAILILVLIAWAVLTG
jgi:hypothetical protein